VIRIDFQEFPSSAQKTVDRVSISFCKIPQAIKHGLLDFIGLLENRQSYWAFRSWPFRPPLLLSMTQASLIAGSQGTHSEFSGKGPYSKSTLKKMPPPL
jgi:hypothetical protein